MTVKEQAESVIEKYSKGSGTNMGTIPERHARLQAKRVIILADALERILKYPDFWCKECGWTGDSSDCLWSKGSYEYPNETDPHCPKCGYNECGALKSFVDEFDPEDYACQALKQAEEV